MVYSPGFLKAAVIKKKYKRGITFGHPDFVDTIGYKCLPPVSEIRYVTVWGEILKGSTKRLYSHG